MLFSGVFDTGSIFKDGGTVMDENGRNGGNWHLAQQITELVIKPHIMQSSMTTNHTTCNHTKTRTIHIACNHTIMHILFITIIITQIWGGFYFFYKYQKFPPVYNYNNLQSVNK